MRVQRCSDIDPLAPIATRCHRPTPHRSVSALPPSYGQTPVGATAKPSLPAPVPAILCVQVIRTQSDNKQGTSLVHDGTSGGLIHALYANREALHKARGGGIHTLVGGSTPALPPALPHPPLSSRPTNGTTHPPRQVKELEIKNKYPSFGGIHMMRVLTTPAGTNFTKGVLGVWASFTRGAAKPFLREAKVQ